MDDKARLFLTPSQALRAIRLDFDQYAPQTSLFCNLVPSVWGVQALIAPGTGAGEFWLRTTRSGPLRRVSDRTLRDLILLRLEADPPPPEGLAAICRQVFRTRAVIGSHGGRAGLWIETGMEAFACRRCGHCCCTLFFRNAGTARDYRRIERAGRPDILVRMAPVRRSGRIVSCRLWIEPTTGAFSEICPWLIDEADGGHSCAIYDLRPQICREYPGSRKHAEMTGCAGFRS